MKSLSAATILFAAATFPLLCADTPPARPKAGPVEIMKYRRT